MGGDGDVAVLVPGDVGVRNDNASDDTRFVVLPQQRGWLTDLDTSSDVDRPHSLSEAFIPPFTPGGDRDIGLGPSTCLLRRNLVGVWTDDDARVPVDGQAALALLYALRVAPTLEVLADRWDERQQRWSYPWLVLLPSDTPTWAGIPEEFTATVHHLALDAGDASTDVELDAIVDSALWEVV